jgi:hypothetical protein
LGKQRSGESNARSSRLKQVKALRLLLTLLQNVKNLFVKVSLLGLALLLTLLLSAR